MAMNRHVGFKGVGFLPAPQAPPDTMGKENLDKLIELKQQYEECYKLAQGKGHSLMHLEYQRKAAESQIKVEKVMETYTKLK